MAPRPKEGVVVFEGQHLRGTLAAALTPLAEGGRKIDESAVEPMVTYLVAHGVDAILAMGTAGEGWLLSMNERQRLAERFVGATEGRFPVVVQCGAQTTADTVTLARHAADIRASGVAVIGPPYFALDDTALLAHFGAAAAACAPLPFYVYVFAARSGYVVSPQLLSTLRDAAPNFVGMKISESPWERFAPYLIDGLDVFVGPEALISRGMVAGAVGAASALAGAMPEVVSEAVRDRTPEAAAAAAKLRTVIQNLPYHAALKRILARRGVPISEAVRAPLRPLTGAEKRILDESGMYSELAGRRDAGK